MGVNVAQVLRQWAQRAPTRVALIDRAEVRRCYTFAALDRRALGFAGALREAGLEVGDRLALVAENGVGFVIAFMGAAYAGVTVVPVPILSAPPELRFRLAHARCRAVAHDAARSALVTEALRGLAPGVATVRLRVDVDLGTDEYSDPDRAVDEPCTAPPLAAPEDVSPAAVAMILYTSGTTGVPKGACITHASLATHTAALVHHALGFGPDTTVLGVLPLTHSYGIRMALLAPWYAGGRVVLLPRFEAEGSLRVAAEEQVDWIPGVPTMFAAWAAAPEAAAPRWPALSWCLSAGAPLPDEVRARAAARLGADVRQGYGLTEATFSCLDAPTGPTRPGSVGPPVWGVEVAVHDEAGRHVAVGATGEVVVRGQNVMAGYLDDPDATASVRRDGWLRTGDVGWLGPDGALTVVDRTKDLILRGGNNVYPSEVEAVLQRHPDVAEVAVVGRPEPHYGEEVVAIVRLASGARLDRVALDGFCRAELSAFKVPRAYGVIDRMPLGPSSKVLKRQLREWLRDGTLQPEK